MRIRLAIAVAPVWVWGAVISALPHKEERFLFPVYPLVKPCLHPVATSYVQRSSEQAFSAAGCCCIVHDCSVQHPLKQSLHCRYACRPR